jgi:hypothetical protein
MREHFQAYSATIYAEAEAEAEEAAAAISSETTIQPQL